MPSSFTSHLFSGYLPIANGGHGFYFFAESQSATPHEDPVLLWLNGGPGASSLAGCVSENGSLLINPDGETLRVNEYSWNMNDNLLCIESPVGVGFTYNASHIYKSDDTAQADDLYWMLQVFFTKFTHLRRNDFIVAAESYGGVYVPTAAKRIVQGNEIARANNQTEVVINLKRFAVGDGINEYWFLSIVSFAYHHALISTEQYAAIKRTCSQLLSLSLISGSTITDECQTALGQFQADIAALELNHYNLYDRCNGYDMDGADILAQELQGPLEAVVHPMALPLIVCLNWTDVLSFFNIPQVRRDLHTKEDSKHWNHVAFTSMHENLKATSPSMSDDRVDEVLHNKVLEYNSSARFVGTPVWKYLVDHGVDGVIYHGDADMACDFIGGQWAVESLGLPRQRPRRSVWTAPSDEQSGVLGPTTYSRLETQYR